MYFFLMDNIVDKYMNKLITSKIFIEIRKLADFF